MDTFRLKRFCKSISVLSVALSLFAGAHFELAADENVNSREDLEWGTVLFDYYQKDYLNALIEHRYAVEIDNAQAKTNHGRLLKGGMLLSYGMAEPAEVIFRELLNDNTSAETRNSAWYYLANLHYHKSEPQKAFSALQNIKGDVSPTIVTEYHYLATLISGQGKLSLPEKDLNTLQTNNPYYAYILFNNAIRALKEGNVEKSLGLLQEVSRLGATNNELAVLADRAKHGIAQINLQRDDSTAAWESLKAIRTNGLYSNRALLTYAWTAIKLKQFRQAIPALTILDERSIAIPEVQEAKVLLAHLYEQEGSPRKALKSNLLAIESFDKGIKLIQEARQVIAKQDVPKEFIMNFDAIVGQSDWYAMEPTVDYDKLTPFVLDLISSHAFNETLRELSDLYTIQNNLSYWSDQAKEHTLILGNSNRVSLQSQQKKMLNKSLAIKKKLDKKRAELRLYALTLDPKERKKLEALVESTDKQLASLNSRVKQLKRINKPYQPPKGYQKIVSNKHKDIKRQLSRTEKFIAKLEPVLRKLINAELNKHEERMRYYSAQSRLAKARLYDATLMDIKKARSAKSKPSPNTSEGK